MKLSTAVVVFVAVAAFMAIEIYGQSAAQYCNEAVSYLKENQDLLANAATRQQYASMAKSLIQSNCASLKICNTACANTAINCLNEQAASATLISNIDSCCSQC
ncbi:unnamed protein product [Bursaphelenchus okinawaensis]|uniref:Uncharacterized protein n=1 Tax=Bursaphelenchus okinawaensis TaxID=465554 RepID=A0A811K1Q7_9BILA|nr:unnamed protein product [Bursaphelenchus okinawaensis]CAG9089958.1 unnamed protein product [Bursaphelenchus okinawaensis]